jgi:hypothetical protein
MTGFLIPFKGMGRDGRNVDLTAKVAGQVAKVRALLNDRSRAVILPPLKKLS